LGLRVSPASLKLGPDGVCYTQAASGLVSVGLKKGDCIRLKSVKVWIG